MLYIKVKVDNNIRFDILYYMEKNIDIINELQKRGLIQSISGQDGALEKWLSGGKRTIYFGFDPTADSLHVGHAVPLLIMRTLKKAGHNVIILAGGATGMIGDPSFKSEERVMLDIETVQNNADKILKQVRLILNDDSIIYVNNYDWFSKMNTLDFLRDVGKHISVHGLFKRESVQLRLNSENFFSFTEFTYSLIQGYDFVELSDTHNCSVQIGGADQWGNLLSGVDLGRKMRSRELFAMSCPLLLDSKTGRKFGKTEGGAIWLDPELTSPYEMYQFYMSADDTDVERFLKIFTDMSVDEIEVMIKTHNEAPEKRTAQKVLALGSVAIFHGSSAANDAKRATELLFNSGMVHIDSESVRILGGIIPTISVYEETNLLNVLVENGIATSKRDGRQLIESKAIMVNGEIVGDENHAITLPALLRKGKRDYYLLIN